MPRRRSKTLTDRELEIMRMLWSLGQVRLGELHEALNQSGDSVAVSTVAMQLDTLMRKGYVRRYGRFGRSTYAPIWSQVETVGKLLDDFLVRAGLRRAPGFLIQMLKNEQLTAEDRAALQDLLRESEPETPRRPRSPSTPPPSVEEE